MPYRRGYSSFRCCARDHATPGKQLNPSGMLRTHSLRLPILLLIFVDPLARSIHMRYLTTWGRASSTTGPSSGRAASSWPSCAAALPTASLGYDMPIQTRWPTIRGSPQRSTRRVPGMNASKRRRHCINFTRIAVVVLNQKVHPFTARWHARMLAGKLGEADRHAFRAGLRGDLQTDLRNYTRPPRGPGRRGGPDGPGSGRRQPIWRER